MSSGESPSQVLSQGLDSTDVKLENYEIPLNHFL